MRKRRRWWKIAAFAIGALALSAIVAVVAFGWYAQRRLDEQLALWRASNDPLLALPPLTDAEREQTDVERWLANFATGACGDCNDQLDASAIQALPVCAEEFERAKRDELDFMSNWFARIRDATSPSDCSACDVAVADAIGKPALECAARVHELLGLDDFPGTRALRRDGPLEDVVRDLPIQGFIQPGKFVFAALRYRVAHRDSGDALSLTEDELDIARVAKGAPCVFGFALFCMLEGWALECLRESLEIAPRDFDSTRIERELNSVDVHQLLLCAVREDRFAGVRTFDHSASGVFQDARAEQPAFIPDWYFGLVTKLDEAAYLTTMSRVIAQLESNAWRDERTDAQSTVPTTPVLGLGIITGLITPHIESSIRVAIAIDVKIAFARAALINHRDGTEAARAWLATQIDPYDGKPLRSRVEANGVLVLWSIGRDLQDDEEPPKPTVDEPRPRNDLVWRLPAH